MSFKKFNAFDSYNGYCIEAKKKKTKPKNPEFFNYVSFQDVYI